MKRPPCNRSFITLALLGLLVASPAQAGNSSLEANLQNYGDLSMFYQGLLNTGVINELRENGNYTVFAPTNAAFAAEISRQTYPCFYAVECRPQIAVLLRNHIVEGGYDLPVLATYGQGVRTIGNSIIHVSEPFVGDYAVNGRRILSHSEMANNIVYRIDGVIATPQELNQFLTVAYVPAANTITTTTTVQKTYSGATPLASYPAGTMVITPPADSGQTTTVTHTYTTEQ